MLTKQAIDVSFAQGLDTKTDKKRVQVGKFLELQNTVFDKGGLLQKRNGYAALSSLPDTSYSYLTTFNGNLTAIGPNIGAYNTAGASWVQKGSIQPLSLSALPVIRNNLNQTACDIVVAPSGIACCVYLESNGSSTVNKYVIFDSVTGQNISPPALIPVASGAVGGGMRVFVLGNNFIMVFTNVISGTSHLQYVAVSIADPTIIGANTDIASSYIPTARLNWDGVTVNNHFYIAYNTTAGGQSVKITYLTAGLTLATNPHTYTGLKSTLMNLTADITDPANPLIWMNTFDTTTTLSSVFVVDQNLNPAYGATVNSGGGPVNIAAAVQNGVCTVFSESPNNYSGSSGLPTNFIYANIVPFAQTPGAPYNVVRGVGLASKAFIVDGTIGFLASYQSAYQSSYFLINGSECVASSPVIAAKLAYENGGGYLTTGLPGVTVSGSSAKIPYLIKDLIQAVNKNTNVPTGTQVNGIFSQTGINLATFDIGTKSLDTTEIGNNLHISGGFHWMYDGYLPVEEGFFLWPDLDQGTASDAAVWSTTGGSMASHPQGGTMPDPNPGAYYYQYTYEWTDNQGNAYRSAPSIPLAVSPTSTGTIGSVTLIIPTLRLTMKTANPVKIVVYRWSLGQQNYYQTTSVTNPLLNDTTADSVTFVDTHSDATILGNNLLYTTGGVVENVNAPASDLLAIFDTRLWLVDAEDKNLLWFSKQVIESAPVEMSDLFTVYVPPTTSTQGSTGPITSISAMDDKLIIGKKNAFLYINGSGPDNTGANNQYSQPLFITSTVGCSNQKSIVLTPQGLMFQSDKGIWLMGRGLDTSYIGAPVQDFTLGATVLSAVNVPETNQVRFTLDTGVTLMYDYFYGQWGTFFGIPCVSSCIFQEMHTFINGFGQVYQESPGSYLDGSNPVLMRFTTGPLRLGDLQGYQRAFFFYILGTYISPHKLWVSMTYDYEVSPSQSVLISPTNYSTPFGAGPSQSPFGQGDPFGGGTDLESWRLFLERQRCMAFGITVQEIFDPTFGTTAGAGLTISGLNIVMGFKKGFRPQPNANSIG